MPSTAASKRFLQVYDALPPDAQQLLVQRHLAPLLDTVSKDRQRRVSESAAEMRRRYARMPSLNLKTKKAEVATLLLELSRDSKRSMIKERSRRDQLLSEAVDSLTAWLNDIWKVVFEFRTNFAVAHACLLFTCEALNQISSGCGGCYYATMFIPIKIRKSTGKVVKSFMLNGAYNLETVVLWIWRDLFMAILATGTERQRSTIPDMIDDIRVLLGWRALEQLLRGGSKCRSSHLCSSTCSSCVPLSHTDVGSDDDDEPCAAKEFPNLLSLLDDEEENYTSDDDSTVCDEELHPSSFYAAHWSWRFTDQQPQLRHLIHRALFDIFKVSPSGPLYSSMAAITDDEDELEDELHPLLMSVAGHSSENLSAALRIMSLNNRTASINMLLETHKHLLRPQDAASLQFSVLILSSNHSYHAHASSIIEEELFDVANAFRAVIHFSFCNIDSEINKTELRQILALRQDALNRRNRVERWVKGAVTPQVDTVHPMAFAALMMGIPLPPGAEDTEGDMLGYFEVDGDEPEVEDLREEFRPNIKARLQGWVDTAAAVKGGQALLMKVYAKITVEMPFLHASDIVEEMSNRMADRPSKQHVCDALEAFREFCEKQNLKIAAVKASRRKAGNTANASRPPASGPGPGTFSSAAQQRTSATAEDID